MANLVKLGKLKFDILRTYNTRKKQINVFQIEFRPAIETSYETAKTRLVFNIA